MKLSRNLTLKERFLCTVFSCDGEVDLPGFSGKSVEKAGFLTYVIIMR